MSTKVLHVMLAALTEYVSKNMKPEDYYYALDNEPQSHVFYADEYDPDDFEAVRDVTESDLRAKVAYWTGVAEDIG